jgi:rubrerythrin
MEEITFSEIISYAKIAEDNAKQFYLDAAAKATQSNVKELLEALAAQEQKHKDYLEELDTKIKAKGAVPEVHEKIRNLGYARMIEPQTLDADSDYKDVIEVAMQKEKEAIETYEHLFHYVDDPDAKKLFELLLEEERSHLKQFEAEYEDLQDQLN